MSTWKCALRESLVEKYTNKEKNRSKRQQRGRDRKKEGERGDVIARALAINYTKTHFYTRNLELHESVKYIIPTPLPPCCCLLPSQLATKNEPSEQHPFKKISSPAEFVKHQCSCTVRGLPKSAPQRQRDRSPTSRAGGSGWEAWREGPWPRDGGVRLSPSLCPLLMVCYCARSVPPWAFYSTPVHPLPVNRQEQWGL